MARSTALDTWQRRGRWVSIVKFECLGCGIIRIGTSHGLAGNSCQKSKSTKTNKRTQMTPKPNDGPFRIDVHVCEGAILRIS